MVGRPLSKQRKARINADTHRELMNRAMEYYRAEQGKANTKERKGLRAVCEKVEKEHLEATGISVRVSHATLQRLMAGGRTRAEASAEKAWLTEEEGVHVVEFLVELAKEGWPLSHRRLKEVVDDICRAKYGDSFPEKGVGNQWTYRFVEKHKELKMHWSAPLDSVRGRAVNQATHAAWFKLYGEVLKKYSIEQDCIWGTDETGFQPGEGRRERVIGPAKTKVQYQQKDGNRETITVIVTICADGTSIPPTVIMKGKAFQTRWEQDNPLEASIGYSKKGWTDGEIGVAWIEDFDNKTKNKANGRPRLLLVDGHNSHYTYGFLKYAREHNIHVLCYPAHTTHVYQGLDVAVFGPLKMYWSEARDNFERDQKKKVTKENFLAVYGAAHVKALTPQIIQTAFRKTGAWPYNPDAISEDMMAPSRDTSTQSHFPVTQPSPLRAISSLITKLSSTRYAPHQPQEMTQELPHAPSTPDDPFINIPMAVQESIHDLQQTSASFLMNELPIASSSQLPSMQPYMFSPTRPRHHNHLLVEQPQTALECDLQAALGVSIAQNQRHKDMLLGMQSAVILQGVYCEKTRKQLAAQEDKQKDKRRRGKLVGDGLPRLLSSDNFTSTVKAHEAALQQEAIAKKARLAGRKELLAATEIWKHEETARKKRNAERTEAWKAATEQWQKERDRAKLKKRKAPPRPTRGPMEKPVRKPKALPLGSTAEVEEDVEADEDNSDTDAEDDDDVEMNILS